jgi:hypothetical protein
MRSIFFLVFLSTATVRASVDYVSIGAVLSAGKQQVSLLKRGMACLMKDYSQKPSCAQIENIVKQSKNIVADSTVALWYAGSCGGAERTSFSADSVEYLRRVKLKSALDLAKAAEPNDPVHGKIVEFEKSLDDLVAETTDILAKAKFQETYVTQCLLGQEPKEATIIEMLCK